MNLVEAARKVTISKTAVMQAIWTVVAALAAVMLVASAWISWQENWHTESAALLPSLDAAIISVVGIEFLSSGLILWVAILQLSAFVGMGLFLFWRRPNDWLAIMTSMMLIATGVGFWPNAIILPLLRPAWQLPAALLQVTFFTLIIYFLTLFPNGRFVPRWTRFVMISWTVLAASWLVTPLLNPYRSHTHASLLLFVGWCGLLFLAQIYRYRQTVNSSERLQMKWVLGGLGATTACFAALILLAVLGALLQLPAIPNLLTALLGLSSLLLPITIGLAILRYHLYDVDVVINYTLVYGGLTAVTLTLYIFIVGGFSLLFQTQNNLLTSLLATGLIAVLFQPVRERLQRSVNRLMFGERDDPYKVLSKLGRQLGETAVPHQTLPAIAATITQTLKLPYAAIELAPNDQRQLAANSGERGTAVLQEWPLRYQGEIVGWLQAAPRSPGEPFTDMERQLLGDIAAQAGAAAYSLRLTNALQKSREKLVLTREEERRRIRRDLHDELGPTLASQTFAFDAVLDLLESNPQEAARLLRGLKAQNQETVAEIRRLVYELRPPALDELGLVGALQAHAAQLNKPRGLQIQIVARPNPLPPLSAAVEVAAYRIALEAMTNAARHAQAQSCAVRLQAAHTRFTLTVVDDGRGLEPNGRTGVGFHSMRERAEELGGKLMVESENEAGVTVTAVIPLSPQSEAGSA
jgi:signal transduction histidine kinase